MRLRIRLALSQNELAEAVGVSRQTVSSIERGASVPSVRLALALARALETSVEELFSSRGET